MLSVDDRLAVWLDTPFCHFAGVMKVQGSGVRRRDDETASEYADRVRPYGVRALSDEAILSRVASGKAGDLAGVPKAGTLREGGSNQYTEKLR